jgi:hypothetical protein
MGQFAQFVCSSCAIGKEPLQFAFESADLDCRLNFALPNRQHAKTHAAKFGCLLSISGDIVSKLSFPEFGIVLRRRRRPASAMSMPKTAMNKHCPFAPGTI